MNRDATIEEMAKITNFAAFDYKQGTIQSKTIYTAMAEALYNAGYRKVDDDEFVLKQDEVWEFRKDQAEVKFLKDKIKQETAREILKELKDKQIYILENNLFGCNTAYIQGINELAKKYGIELE